MSDSDNRTGSAGGRASWLLDPGRSRVSLGTQNPVITPFLPRTGAAGAASYTTRGELTSGSVLGDVHWWVVATPQPTGRFPATLGPIRFDSGPCQGTQDDAVFDGTMSVGQVRVAACARGALNRVTSVARPDHVTGPAAGDEEQPSAPQDPAGAGKRSVRLIFSGALTLRRDAVSTVLTAASCPLTPLTLMVPLIGDVTVSIHAEFVLQHRDHPPA